MKSVFALIGVLALAYFVLGSPQIRQSLGNMFNQVNQPQGYDQSQPLQQGYDQQAVEQVPPAPVVQPPVEQYGYGNQVQPYVQPYVQPAQMQPQQVWVQPMYQQVWRGGVYQRVLVRAGYYQPRLYAPQPRHHNHFSFDFSAIINMIQGCRGGCR